MKLTALILFIAALQVSATGNAQSVTLSLKNATLETAFKEIRKQTGFGFVYAKEQLQGTKTVDLTVKNESLESVLQQLFKDQPLTYTIQGKFISIRQKTTVTAILPVDVQGKVVDQEGKPVAGATVQIKGTTRGTTTDENGNFSFTSIENNAVLVVSALNIETFEVKVNGRANLATLYAKPKITALSDVQVNVNTGYQSIPKDRATGSFSKPEQEMFNSRIATDPLSKLNGITSGLVFNIDPATNSPYIEIRSRSTIFANASPLIVIDNFPYEGDIQNINPNDVEDITILKDAAAASIWGVRASNGVIVITTKKGALNRPLRVNLAANYTFGQKPDIFYDPNYLNSSTYTEVEKSFFGKGLYDGDIMNGDPTNPFGNFPPLTPVIEILERQRQGLITQAEADAQINSLKGIDVRSQIQDEFYQNSFNQQYALSLSGGNHNTTYFFSGGYDKNNFSVKENGFERFTFNTLNTFTLVKNLQLTAGINYIRTNSSFDNTLSQLSVGGPVGRPIYPYAQLSDANGNPLPLVKDYRYQFAQQAPSNGFQDWTFYPLTELRNGWNGSTIKNNEARISTGLRYNFAKSLSAEVSYQFRQMNSDNRSLRTKESYYVRNMINGFATVDGSGMFTGSEIPVGGIQTISAYSQTSNYVRAQLNYNNNWEKHAVSAIAGFEQRETKSESNSMGMYGYDPATGSHQTVDYTYAGQLYPNRDFGSIPNYDYETGMLDRFRSFYVNGSYTYDGRFTFSASARNDGSNFFGVEANQRFVPLWSVGGKWNLDQESFYNVKWLPVLKFRTTYGYNGNVDRSVTAFTTMNYLPGSLLLSNVRFGIIRNPANDQLGWEKSSMLNIGLDFGLNKNVIAGSIEYFLKKGDDLMGDDLLAPSVGFVNPLSGTNSYRGNFSGMKGSGVEMLLNSQNLNKKLKWTTNFLFTYATSEVTRFDVENKPLTLIERGNGATTQLTPVVTPQIGRPVFGIYSLRWGGLDPSNGDPRGYVADTLSTNYTQLLTPASVDDIVFHGSGRPTTFGGITNTFALKQFSLSFNISYKFGYYFRRNSIDYISLLNGGGHIDYDNRWQKPGDEVRTDVPSMPDDILSNYNRDYFYQLSSALVEKGDHIRFQDISLGYDLTKQQWKQLPFNSIRLNVYVNNIGIIWRANDEGLDPDVFAGYPIPRSISIGFRAGF